MKVRFISLASGSSGNCYYLGTDTYGILIDAGIGIRTIKKTLKDFNILMESIRAVFVTHDHADHIKAVGHLGEKMNIPVYTTARIHEGINRSYCMTEKLSTSVRYLEKQVPMMLEDFRIESFEVPHDGTDNVGYCIEIDGKVFSFLTDLGEITPTAADYISKANYLILEANYDEEMLKMGPYPQYLKERIMSRTGHMSNSATAARLLIPPPTCTGIEACSRIFLIAGRLRPVPAKAPSKSTTCKYSAPATDQRAAISEGSSAKTVSWSKRPSVNLTQRPPRISIAGKIIMAATP